MRYDLLQKIDATDPLATLFNQYLKGLSTLAIMAEPSYVTMAEVRTRYAGTAESEERKHLKHSTRRFFELTVLRNSLHALHGHVVEAITLLEDFFTTYAGDLTRYAVENRLHSIAEWGSDNESDWYRDNEADEAEAWKVVYKDDADSLKYHTLHAELGRFFGSDSRGEHIGTSGPDAFYPYTTMVQQQSAFSFRKMLEGVTGQEAAFTRVADDGSLSPVTLADHIEAEMNEDIRSNDLVLRFDTTLAMCAELGKRFPTLQAEATWAYEALLLCLRDIRDQRLAGYPPF